MNSDSGTYDLMNRDKALSNINRQSYYEMSTINSRNKLVFRTERSINIILIKHLRSRLLATWLSI